VCDGGRQREKENERKGNWEKAKIIIAHRNGEVSD
jgi:hypothetical protein